MSFGVPLMKPTLDGKYETGLRLTEHGVHDALGFGNNAMGFAATKLYMALIYLATGSVFNRICKVKDSLSAVHPLESSEKYFIQNEEAGRMSALRNHQGLHAPLRLAAELRATRSVGRLPFLESSGLSSATLRGSDDTIDFSDILGLPEFDERNLFPHVVMEHHFGDL